MTLERMGVKQHIELKRQPVHAAIFPDNKPDNLQSRREHILEDLGSMFLRFKNADELRTAYTRCILAIEEYSQELRDSAMPPEATGGRLFDEGPSTAAPTAEPKIRTPQGR